MLGPEPDGVIAANPSPADTLKRIDPSTASEDAHLPPSLC
jgi:hypothetical protein